MAEIADELRKIADASKRADGSDIPLGLQLRIAADALDAKDKRIAELGAALGETLHWLEVLHEWEPQDIRCRACAAITAGKALLPAPPSSPSGDANG